MKADYMQKVSFQNLLYNLYPVVLYREHSWDVGEGRKLSSRRENVNVFNIHNPHILLAYTKCKFKQKVTKIS